MPIAIGRPKPVVFGGEVMIKRQSIGDVAEWIIIIIKSWIKLN